MCQISLCSLPFFFPITYSGKDVTTFTAHLENNSVSGEVLCAGEQILLESRALDQASPLCHSWKEHEHISDFRPAIFPATNSLIDFSPYTY